MAQTQTNSSQNNFKEKHRENRAHRFDVQGLVLVRTPCRSPSSMYSTSILKSCHNVMIGLFKGVGEPTTGRFSRKTLRHEMSVLLEELYECILGTTINKIVNACVLFCFNSITVYENPMTARCVPLFVCQPISRIAWFWGREKSFSLFSSVRLKKMRGKEGSEQSATLHSWMDTQRRLGRGKGKVCGRRQAEIFEGIAFQNAVYSLS